MNKSNATKLAFIAVPISVVLITATSLIATAMISGQSSTSFGNTQNSPEPTFSLLTTSSPTPNQQQSSDAITEPESNEPGSNGGNNYRPGGQNVPYMPGWTDAQRACQEEMSTMAAESNRVGFAHTNASNYAVTLSSEMSNKYPGIPNDQWAPEDAVRMAAAWAESERTALELNAFWAQYPWDQWGCDENGLWHVP